MFCLCLDTWSGIYRILGEALGSWPKTWSSRCTSGSSATASATIGIRGLRIFSKFWALSRIISFGEVGLDMDWYLFDLNIVLVTWGFRAKFLSHCILSRQFRSRWWCLKRIWQILPHQMELKLNLPHYSHRGRNISWSSWSSDTWFCWRAYCSRELSHWRSGSLPDTSISWSL